MLLRSDRRFSDFPFLTKTVLENIHRNEERECYTKLNDTKNSDIPGNELDECGYFRYLVLPVNFLNFRLCEIQLGAQRQTIKTFDTLVYSL